MEYISLNMKQEYVSMELSKKIHETLAKSGIILMTKYVWDTKANNIILRDEHTSVEKYETKYLPALSDPELASLLPKHIATMKVNHRDYGNNLFICDHMNNIRYGVRNSEEFHIQEVEIRGRKLLIILKDNPAYINESYK
jgi:hypothetical protein